MTLEELKKKLESPAKEMWGWECDGEWVDGLTKEEMDHASIEEKKAWKKDSIHFLEADKVLTQKQGLLLIQIIKIQAEGLENISNLGLYICDHEGLGCECEAVKQAVTILAKVEQLLKGEL